MTKARQFGIVGMVLCLAAALLPSASLADSSGTQRQYDHVFVIVEENTEFSGIVGNPRAPTFNSLASAYGLATQYFGAIHASEGNYVALVGGSAYAINDDAAYSSRTVNQPSIVDQLEGAGLTWKGYFQSLPYPGYTGTCSPPGLCLYASKHNGFVNFAHVQANPDELKNLVPDTSLANDLAAGTVPNLAFIVPDQCHDLHGMGVVCGGGQLWQQTDAYLAATTTAIMQSDLWSQGTNAIVITSDEGGSNLGCCDATPGGGRVATVVIRNHQPAPVQDATPYNHYSLVATVQQAFGLGCQFNGTPVGFTCDSANGVQPMSALFGLAAA